MPFLKTTPTKLTLIDKFKMSINCVYKHKEQKHKAVTFSTAVSNSFMLALMTEGKLVPASSARNYTAQSFT